MKDTPSGTFKNIIVERVDSIETTLAHILPEFTSNLLAPLAVVVYLFIVDWRVALLSLIPIVLGFSAMMGMFVGYEENFRNTVKCTRELNAAAVEYINGIEVIKAFGRVDGSYEKFTGAARRGADAFIFWMRKCNLFHSLTLILAPYTLLTVLPFGAIFVAGGSLTVSDFIMCVILSLGISGASHQCHELHRRFGYHKHYIRGNNGILTHGELERPAVSNKKPADASIALKNVTFAYHDEEVLHGIDMEMEQGTVNAIVGPSGSGKSTIAKLIASLWDVDGGSISIGGVDIRDMPLEKYNRMIAYVSQDNYLFNELSGKIYVRAVRTLPMKK